MLALVNVGGLPGLKVFLVRRWSHVPFGLGISCQGKGVRLKHVNEKNIIPALTVDWDGQSCCNLEQAEGEATKEVEVVISCPEDDAAVRGQLMQGIQSRHLASDARRCVGSENKERDDAFGR